MALLCIAATAWAVDKVRVVALFPNKAMVEIDGKSRVLKAGKTSPEGVTLISSNSREAVIELDGKRSTLKVDGQIGGTFTGPTHKEVRIVRDAVGAYMTIGSINGRSVEMMVDTGATAVAISEVEAKRLGIPYWLKGEKTAVSTASGVANAWGVTLDKVQVGPIVQRNVQALVVQGGSPRQVLLGMTFLGKVKIENSGNVMVLRTKY
jgi:aspartyl protease family protein